jgi:ergothioneine biosynthesis protein EgtB
MLGVMTVNLSVSAQDRPLPNGLASRFRAVRDATLVLAKPLAPEDCVVQTIPEVSPTKWHLAHVTWFFERFCLLESGEAYEPFNEAYLKLFNSYYYTVGQMHPRAQRGLLNRPLFDEVLAYGRHVDDAMLALIELRAGDAEFAFRVTLGLHHEQQHQELLLTDIKHVFFTNPLYPAYQAPEPSVSSTAPRLEFVPRPGGRFAVGHEGENFCFDNETPRHELLVGEHSLANRLVTNGEYLEFIEDGGYRQSGLWLADGWSRIQAEGWNGPLYWSADRGSEFTLRGWQAIDPAAPVCHLSYYEADAYARWAGARLPTEAEWELAAEPTAIHGNTLDTGSLHTRPLRGERASDRLHQLWGDVWEWTASPYMPYPRFRPLAGSLGEYNGKFMANQMVVRGGSCASWASHLRASYRSFFYPHDRWQFLGLRLALDGGGT